MVFYLVHHKPRALLENIEQNRPIVFVMFDLHYDLFEYFLLYFPFPFLPKKKKKCELQ